MSLLVRLAILALLALTVLACRQPAEERPTSGAVSSATALPVAPAGKGSPGAGTTGEIRGVVRDAAQAPVANAGVGIVRGPGPTVAMLVLTNDRGEYAWPGLTPGEYTLSVTTEGFPPQEKTATVQAGQVTQLDFNLTP